jgi:hypothetical protein
MADIPHSITEEPPIDRSEPGVRVVVGRRYYSEERAAAEVGKSTRTLQRWRAKRIGPPYNELIGGYPEDGLADWAKTNDRQPVPEPRRRRKLRGGESSSADLSPTPLACRERA